jgi:hypothetical protein
MCPAAPKLQLHELADRRDRFYGRQVYLMRWVKELSKRGAANRAIMGWSKISKDKKDKGTKS